jgi:hypothetical protein
MMNIISYQGVFCKAKVMTEVEMKEATGPSMDSTTQK